MILKDLENVVHDNHFVYYYGNNVGPIEYANKRYREMPVTDIFAVDGIVHIFICDNELKEVFTW